MKPETVEVQSLYGPVAYQRDRVAGPASPGDPNGGNGFVLKLPFSDVTRDVRESLRALGFRCHHEERYWELPARAYSREREAHLQALLRCGELPASPRALGALGSPRASAMSPRAAGNKHRLDGEEVEAGPLSPTALAAAAAGGGGGGGSINAQLAAAIEAQEAAAAGGGEGEAVAHLHEGSAAHVVLRRGGDGHMTLEGPGLWNIRPMLERILHFAQLPVAAGTAACAGVGAAPPRWRSAWPLSDAEAAFVEAVLEHRKRSLRNPRHDDREPIPLGLVVPPRFRPRSKDGLAMRGPMLCRRGTAQNIGRQFFAPVQQGGGGGILWADGTEPAVDEEQEKFNEWELAELADREDWQEDVPQESQSGDWGEAGGEGEGVDQDVFD